ncbi:MAG: cation:proton antiporter [Methanomicrobiales archaeon]
MNIDPIILGLGIIITLGILLQWIARIIKIPGIILLLPAGILMGSVLGLVKPLEIFGDALFPIITLGVGLLLLKGGFELKIIDLNPDVGRAVWRLVTLGVVITLAIGTIAVQIIFGIPFKLALLVAALLVVSGPTVVGPILNFARPKEPVGPVLLWEGIIIDPIGASLAVAVLSIITATNPNPILELVVTISVGVIIGGIAALLYMISERSGRVPVALSALVALMFGVMAIFTGELIISEAGLFAAVTMGLILANQKLTSTMGIQVLTETLEPLIIGMLFIILAAMVELSALLQYLLPALGLAAIYILVARPLVALMATRGLNFSTAQKIFIGFMAPRGIVAAATASIFVISLASVNIDFPHLVPVVFLIIMFTVGVYGLFAPLLSRQLKISQPSPNAVAVVSDQPWGFDLADALHETGVEVVLLKPDEDFDSHKTPYQVFTGPISDLADTEITDETHEFKNRIKYLIIASNDNDRILIAMGSFLFSVGSHGIIIFGRARSRQDAAVFGGRDDILVKTPFGLFGRNEDELLDMLDEGGNFEVIDKDQQPEEGGVPNGTEPFLRVKDGKLTVPGTVDPLTEGEYLIVIKSASK